MDTYFAPAERCSNEELHKKIKILSRNPVLDGLMKSISGILAVLDEHRQILAVNDSMLEMFDIEDAGTVLGLRPGKAINCIHAREGPGGCGTTKFCSTCGVAGAIVASLDHDKPAEEICAATIKKNVKEMDICFQVRCSPIKFEGYQLLLLFMQDITSQQAWASLEKTFFHDINNTLTGLLGATELMTRDGADQELITMLSQSVLRLKKEIDIQRVLSHTKDESYKLSLQEVPVTKIVKDLQDIFLNHPVARGKSLVILQPLPDQRINTDHSLLLRVLTNMLTNAFEATEAEGKVKFWIDKGETIISFCVWNKQVIPENVRLRIFQRHFSTKQGSGRGIGTFSMKLFGEEFLKGKIDFTTSEEDGTVFRLTMASSLVANRSAVS